MYDLLFLEPPVFLCRLKRYQFPLAHNDHILFTVAAKFRKCRRCLRIPALLADDQFASPRYRVFLEKYSFSVIALMTGIEYLPSFSL